MTLNTLVFVSESYHQSYSAKTEFVWVATAAVRERRKWVKRQITVRLRTADTRPQLWLTVIMLVRVHVYCSRWAVGEFYRNA